MEHEIDPTLSLEENLAQITKTHKKRAIRNLCIGAALGVATMVGGLILAEKMNEKIEPAIED